MLRWEEIQNHLSIHPTIWEKQDELFNILIQFLMLIVVSLCSKSKIHNNFLNKASISFFNFSFQMRSAADMSPPTSRAEIQSYAENLDIIFDGLACPTFE